MPSYELFFITKRLSKKELVSCLKRTGELILNSSGILRKLENLGTRQLPFKLRTPVPGSKRYASGNFFLFHCDVPPLTIYKIHESLRMDTDIMKVRYTTKDTKIPDDYECTLEEELKPPALRPSVQMLVKQNEERIKKSKLTPTVD
ncbi:unnamed protein product [Medioppia subpectinata]|uniref:Small ribosomal subunit protein bS6m n=1 Tax=Medioppia subpectinata TaxID=1979941 RepID=A0A7R9PWF7_9ACAR|nr:unnamed protein product [Medioppia subpectinata]CAG2103877.1 unnamed protein product [Medioppia subpectinata]